MNLHYSHILQTYVRGLVLLFLFSFSVAYAQVEWIKTTSSSDLGLNLAGDAQVEDMAIDKQDNLYLTGAFNDHVIFDDTTILTNREPIFLAKYQPDGGVEWVQEIGGNSNNEGRVVAVNDSGHVYIAGVYLHTNSNTLLDFGNLTLAGDREENLFLAKATGDGTFLWAVGMIADDLLGPSQYIHANDMLVDQQGNIYITGALMGSVTIEGVQYNTDPDDVDNNMMFLAKYTPDGALDWFRHTTGQTSIGWAIGYQLSLASNGDLLLSGQSNNAQYDGAPLPDIGMENNPEKFIARLTPSGDFMWIHPMNSRLGDQKDFSFGVDNQDNVYTTLAISSNIYFEDSTILFPYNFMSDNLLIKLDGNGNRLFFKDTGYPSVFSTFELADLVLTTRDDGTSFMTGNAFSPSADHFVFGADSLYMKAVPNPTFVYTPFIAAFDANGQALGVENYVDEHLGDLFAYDILPSTILTDHGKLFISGDLDGEFRFGNDTIIVDFSSQLFLTQINPAFLGSLTSIDRMPERLDFTLYPNPAQDRVRIDLEQLPMQQREVMMVDLQGKILHQEVLLKSSVDLDLSGMSSGIYYVLIKDKTGIFSRKLVIR